MDNLNGDLNDLNERIEELEVQIANAKSEAEENIMPLEAELKQVKQDKSRYGAKNDFDCVQECRRKEENLKFKISSQWNRYSILKNTLAELKKQKTDLENKIQLKRDRIRRNEAIKSQMNLVLENYRKTQNLRQAAIDAHISPTGLLMPTAKQVPLKGPPRLHMSVRIPSNTGMTGECGVSVRKTPISTKKSCR